MGKRYLVDAEIGPIIGLSTLYSYKCGKMNIQVNEQLIVEALDGMRKNDTQSITEAGNYLLFVIKNPTNLMLLFAIVNSAYSNSVTTDSSLLTPRLVN